MHMKRLLSLALAAVLTFGLAGCGGSSASQDQTPKDYPAILTASRPQEDNDSYTVFTLEDGAFGAVGAYADELSAEQIDTQGQLSLDMLGLSAEDIQKAAFSVSLMNVHAYGIAIVQPAEGRTDAVKQALSTFIEAQKTAQENYLPDQYAIAKAARLETVKSGEVVLVMCAGQDDVYDSIAKALG